MIRLEEQLSNISDSLSYIENDLANTKDDDMPSLTFQELKLRIVQARKNILEAIEYLDWL